MRAKLERDYVMIGESVPMRALRQQISYAAPTTGRILIYGESGTGKELVARALHVRSLRASKPFVEVNCAAIPEELIESELFGHVKGAFTGATQAKRGKFEQADDATLFLDEVGDMSLKTQSKVLRALEEQRFQPVGSEATVSVDVRVIAATNKKLEAEIERGTFRADLFYRLNVIPFEIPPLRERLEDVPLLVEHFNREFSSAHKREPKQFTPAALERMQSYHWPGNVRELRNTVELTICLS
jgi:two-component system nitrogen regulation response regulator NtrX